MKRQRWRLLAAAAAVTATATGTAGSPPAQAAGGYQPGARPIALPLLPGAFGGAVVGGLGRTLLGSVIMQGGTVVPTRWVHRAGKWQVTDLSSGGRLTGSAVSEDGRGDVLINGEDGSSAWVVTPAGAVNRLRGFPGRGSEIDAAAMSARGQVVGTVRGRRLGPLGWGAFWPGFTASPRRLLPLPFPHSADATPLGVNNDGDVVGNSINAALSVVVGGVWPGGRSHGFVLPGLRGSHQSFPVQINDSDVAVGEASDAMFSEDGAAVWVGRALHFLGTAVPTDSTARLLAIAPDGRAVGESDAPDETTRAIYWPGLRHSLRVLAPLSKTWQTGQASAHYVSDDGLVGGQSADRSGTNQPVVWPDADSESLLPNRP